jgi:hypothetical protein
MDFSLIEEKPFVRRITSTKVSAIPQVVDVYIDKCVWDEHSGDWVIYRDGDIKANQHMFHDVYPTLDAAMEVCDSDRAEGVVVIVKPNYPEKDNAGKFSREWQSWNGEPFEEIITRLNES